MIKNLPQKTLLIPIHGRVTAALQLNFVVTENWDFQTYSGTSCKHCNKKKNDIRGYMENFDSSF